VRERKTAAAVAAAHQADRARFRKVFSTRRGGRRNRAKIKSVSKRSDYAGKQLEALIENFNSISRLKSQQMHIQWHEATSDERFSPPRLMLHRVSSGVSEERKQSSGNIILFTAVSMPFIDLCSRSLGEPHCFEPERHDSVCINILHDDTWEKFYTFSLLLLEV
jgi:hypothetical protein